MYIFHQASLFTYAENALYFCSKCLLLPPISFLQLIEKTPHLKTITVRTSRYAEWLRGKTAVIQLHTAFFIGS